MRNPLLFIAFVVYIGAWSQPFEKEKLYSIGMGFPLDSGIVMDFSDGWEYEDTDTLNKYKQKVEYFIFQKQDTIQLKRTYKPPLWNCIKYSDYIPFRPDVFDLPPHRDYYTYQAATKDTAAYRTVDYEGFNKWLKEEERIDSIKIALKKKAIQDRIEADSLNQVERNIAEEKWENYMADQLLKAFPGAFIDICVNFDHDSLATVNFRIVMKEEEKYFGYDFTFHDRPLNTFQMIMNAILSMRRKRK